MSTSENPNEAEMITPAETATAEAAESPTPKTKPPAKSLYRVRITYSRQDALRYVSHLDMQTVWERTLRRAGVPLAYSQGFNPRPRLHLASALPLGFLSRCELTDFWMELPEDSPAPDLVDWVRRVRASAPPGLDIQQAEFVSLNAPALQTQVQSSEYLAVPMDPLDAQALIATAADLLHADTLPRERRGKPYDLRPLIETLEVRTETNMPQRPTLFMRLAARDGATGRPEEVLSALGLDPTLFRVERIRLILS